MDGTSSARAADLAGSGACEAAVAGARVQHAARRDEPIGWKARLEPGIYGVGCAGKCEGKPGAIAGRGWRAGFKAGFAAAISLGCDFALRIGAHGAFARGCIGHEERGAI